MNYTIDIDVEYEGHYVPERKGKMNFFSGKYEGSEPARIDGFQIFKFDGQKWHDITFMFEPKELAQRRSEYLTIKEEEREQELGDAS